MSSRPVVPLEQLRPGAQAIVRAFEGGAELWSRLAAMGLARDTNVEMLQNTGRGPVLVRVHDARIALGRGEAMKILVEEAVDAPAG